MADAEGRRPVPGRREEFTITLSEETARKLRRVVDGKRRVYKMGPAAEDLASTVVQQWVDAEYDIMYKWNELPSEADCDDRHPYT